MVDYMMADTETLKIIKFFSVIPHLGLSDHECLSLSLKTAARGRDFYGIFETFAKYGVQFGNSSLVYFKTGYSSDPENYLGIALGSMIAKVIDLILLSRVKKRTSNTSFIGQVNFDLLAETLRAKFDLYFHKVHPTYLVDKKMMLPKHGILGIVRKEIKS